MHACFPPSPSVFGGDRVAAVSSVLFVAEGGGVCWIGSGVRFGFWWKQGKNGPSHYLAVTYF